MRKQSERKLSAIGGSFFPWGDFSQPTDPGKLLSSCGRVFDFRHLSNTNPSFRPLLPGAPKTCNSRQNGPVLRGNESEFSERISKVIDVSRVAIHYGYLPLIVYLGYTYSEPRPSLFKLFSPLA
ncbi:Tom7-domain-containing protein [Aspergillus steynii IBT 23096]|uniref:Tom7-domain-containing protein n=1 Tax=Aspergillus steynii IBT 23096 TaxID=1392250 RepID=A0A2I2G9H7_9EURO|nr:Tom7-domain-containing protein [Aspergillus steynii IBT 23096]PLB49531.1 Tom7-domain-containing protein [Aspergillus steynii IBT 23096]